LDDPSVRKRLVGKDLAPFRAAAAFLPAQAAPLVPVPRHPRFPCPLREALRPAPRHSFQVTPLDVKGSGPENLPKENLGRLNHLTAHLPENGSHLTPPGRRLIFRVATGDDVLVRVYDRANAPDSVSQGRAYSGARCIAVLLSSTTEKCCLTTPQSDPTHPL
jgi:hypothetical protein